MKTTINIKGKDVEIELTPDQLQKIKKASIHYTDIKSFKDACDCLGIDVVEWMDDYENLPIHVVAYMQLCIICKALNGAEVMDYKDVKVYKYYPWFNSVGSGSGFSCYGFGCAYSLSGVGSRLCLKSREIAEYAGKQFIEIYNSYIN